MVEDRKVVAGEDYPGTWSEFLKWFPDEAACAGYLERLRWRGEFACPSCGVVGAPYRASRNRLMCVTCEHQTSVTAGTLFDKTRTPLTVWFAAAWYLTSQKHGVSALGLQRVLGLGSYQTAWTLVHRFRRAMVRPDRTPLQGAVQVDETYVELAARAPSGAQGLIGKRRTGKLLVVMAVETLEPSGIGRIRLQRIPAAAQEHVQPFIEASIDPRAAVHTDGSMLYSFLDREGYRHIRTIVQDVNSRPIASLPAVNRVASLLKRWLLGTHHGAVQPSQLDHYLEEFVFRFNRRNSRSRGMLFYRLLEQAAQSGPVTYRDVVDGRPPMLPVTIDWS